MLRRSCVGLGIAYLRLSTCRMTRAIPRMTIWLHYRVFPHNLQACSVRHDIESVHEGTHTA